VGTTDTVVSGAVDPRVRRVTIEVGGVERDAHIKEGFFLRVVPARGVMRVRAYDAEGQLLRERSVDVPPPIGPNKR